jgi:ribonuclease HIII
MSVPPHSYVVTINVKRGDQLLQDLKQQGFEITIPPYTLFSAKKKGVSCTLYTSGKLVVQGKECAAFIEFYLEPEILKTFAFRYPVAHQDTTARIGIDESGKGDFFGPLCIAGVYVSEEGFAQLSQLGVKDSKDLSDTSIEKIADKIKQHYPYHVVKINPPKYNQLYADFKNLNHLLAWGHATAIEQLVEQTGCREVMIDQFADEAVVERALKRKHLTLHLTQRHRAEENLAVAAASILARQAFIQGLRQLSVEIGITLPKGSSAATQQVGIEIVKRWGEERLRMVCKQHFKTLDLILKKVLQ